MAIALAYPSRAEKDMAMNALPSIFFEHDRVTISDGLMHGFAATVVGVPSPGKLALDVDELGGSNRIIVADTNVEPCKPDDQRPPNL
jgi:hypothetical protein